jgi:hypothetical protein
MALGSASRRHRFSQVVGEYAQPQPYLIGAEAVARSRIIFTSCLASLIHCSAVPRLL